MIVCYAKVKIDKNNSLSLTSSFRAYASQDGPNQRPLFQFAPVFHTAPFRSDDFLFRAI